MDVDEMIIKASTGDEGAGGHLGSALPPPSAAHPALNGSGRFLDARRREREGASPSANGVYASAYGGVQQQQQQQQQPGAMRGPGLAGSGGAPPVVYTTHVFAPVVTGAPTKKTKFPNSLGTFSPLPHSLPF